MFHGVPAKTKRSSVVQVDYVVNILEIRPWPPSQSLKAIRSVLIQWENGERSSGSTNAAVPQPGPTGGEGKIEFNESFQLHLVLAREISKGDPNSFQKNCLEFSLYEPRRDKTVKGQLLGTSIINLADYGVVRDTLSLNAPVNCTRSYKNIAQPILYFEIMPAKKVRKNSLPENILSREGSMDRNDLESVSSTAKDEFTEEAELASFTDDDISSHSSTTVTSSTGDPAPENDECIYESAKDGKDAAYRNGISEHKESLKANRSQSDFTTNNGSVESHANKNIASNGNMEPEQFNEGDNDSDPRIGKLNERVKTLEEELREAAAVEVSLYSIVAEHGSSINKLHAPARRLSRLYMHACKDNSRIRVVRAAKSAASGLVLVAKACGNDVPRLTFWLSNCVMLRAIISKANADSEILVSSGNIGSKTSSPSIRSTEAAARTNKNDIAACTSSVDWTDPQSFTSALGKIENWIFFRIVESIWWQTLTPHMQSAAAKGIEFSKPGKSLASSLNGQDQGHFSLLLWKKAFKDACDRLCPIRAAGHECGCLPVLAKLVMEQCVARLDVAMFNAILRETDDDIPTDPVSDPISDPRVLPIQAGKSSFGAGVQLKNVIGDWSRMFSEVFGIDEDDSIVDDGDQISINDQQDMSFRSFNILNTLSDLLMLPKDMLVSKSIREEICPAFGPQLIKRILETYVPDEFCPDPVPKEVFQALEIDAEEITEAGQVCITNFPITAPSPTYLPPLASSLSSYIEENGKSQLKRTSSVLRKSYTSDNELDEIDMPLSSICLDGIHSPSVPRKANNKTNGAETAIRYQLLRKVWEEGC